MGPSRIEPAAFRLVAQCNRKDLNNHKISVKNPSWTLENRTRNIPACSAVQFKILWVAKSFFFFIFFYKDFSFCRPGRPHTRLPFCCVATPLDNLMSREELFCFHLTVRLKEDCDTPDRGKVLVRLKGKHVARDCVDCLVVSLRALYHIR